MFSLIVYSSSTNSVMVVRNANTNIYPIQNTCIITMRAKHERRLPIAIPAQDYVVSVVASHVVESWALDA